MSFLEGERFYDEAQEVHYQVLVPSLVSNVSESMLTIDYSVYDFSINPHTVYSDGL
jgi:hypothetical protein